MVTSYSCCRLLLFWARELITSLSLTNHIWIFTFPLLSNGRRRNALTEHVKWDSMSAMYSVHCILFFILCWLYWISPRSLVLSISRLMRCVCFCTVSVMGRLGIPFFTTVFLTFCCGCWGIYNLFCYRYSFPVDLACLLVCCLFGGLICLFHLNWNSLCCSTRTFFLIFPPLYLFLHLIDGWPRDSQSWLIDTPFFAKDSPKEWPQTHPERCHSQCRVWGPGQQVHPATPGSCSWGQSQQVQVSRINSLKWSEDELSFHGTEWAEKGNRQSIHMTEPWRRINDPFTSQRIQLKKNRLIQSLNNSVHSLLFAYIHRPVSTDLTPMITLTPVYTSVYCRSASTTPSGSPCSSQQSVYHPGNGDAQAALTAPNTQPSWNPFGDDNFSKLTAEELLNKDFAKLAESKFSLHT